MKHVYTRLLRDDELRPHLKQGDTVVFKGTAKAWQEIERQVERLGFENEYAVSRTSSRGATREEDVVRVTPVRTRSEG